ncbi:ribosome biogenesis regulatory protein-domain-containing protein [Radiomyces spectabilis]|uniref:ribosome biogenesis regulatory protein-domain-containing protein n=1 Tax=Radiomyces spectabilis TaxID=64574 RepID=UPI0022201150|nr:ribosome biogenesis regulatory protein-domain-containing protein [Radiomyces spectabilis]KAI8384418.1 ribosome biogenesis regulatory protein-domain-containing protein [Radiomyces spectabilis]
MQTSAKAYRSNPSPTVLISKPITVEKLIPLEFDLNLLAGFDTNAFDDKELKNNREAYIKNLTRDNTQLLVNEIFKLPIQSGDAGVLAQLPARTSILPREKPLPKEKPLTRWEKFAKAKGIQNRKRERMVWDDESQEFVPRWGYAGGKDKDKLASDWLIEVPQDADPMEDQYAKRREDKKARVEKNAKRQKRNLEETAVATMAGKKDVREFKKAELQAAIAASKTATASLGKFDTKLKNEPKAKGVTHQVKKKKGSLSCLVWYGMNIC